MEMRNRIFRKLLWGGIIVLAGICYLLFNIGVLPIAWKSIVLSWEALLIVLGFVWIITRRYFWGSVVLAVGVISLLPQLSVLMGFKYSEQLYNAILWPVVVILVGILVMSHSLVHHHHNNHYYRHHPKYWREFKDRHQFHETDCGTDGRVKYDYVLNGIDEVFLGPVFKGGEINVVLGGVKLDLRRSSLPEGDVILKISAVCGGINLFIPQDWPVEIDSQSLLSGFEDKRGTNGTYVDRKLIIVVDFIMSGGEIKC
jgi:predicted membrane protein